jgi:uncharacterized protein (TIGR03435 family)
MVASATMGIAAQEGRPSFEVVSITRSTQIDSGGTLMSQPGGRFRGVNVDVRSLITYAYRRGTRLFNSQIVGAPDWVNTERYDIVARAGGELAANGRTILEGVMQLCVQSMLDDRFGLRLHRETRDLPRYALTVANKQGTLGPQMHPVTRDCVTERERCRIQNTPGHLDAGAMSMQNLIAFFGGNVERVVVDRTGLAGSFDVELDWSADQPDSDKPSLVAAVQEQLGLKLEAERGPVEIIVIDHVERPSPN